jgi:hypothetical protein
VAAMVKALKNAKVPVFDAQAFLDSAGVARKVVEYRRSQKIYFKRRRATGVSPQAGRIFHPGVDRIKLAGNPECYIWTKNGGQVTILNIVRNA